MKKERMKYECATTGERERERERETETERQRQRQREHIERGKIFALKLLQVYYFRLKKFSINI